MKGEHEPLAWQQPERRDCRAAISDSQRSHRLVLLGPPGVGKGTQAELLSASVGACHLSTGDLLRAARCQQKPSPAMQEALQAMHRGELVPDAVIVSMVRERAECLRCHGGFLLDGFPRTVSQAAALDKLLSEQAVCLDFVIQYELPMEEIVARLSGRRFCPDCQAVYHVANCPPRTPGICDHCGGTLAQRDDDRPEAIRVRMRAYEETAQPLDRYYEDAGILIRVEAVGSPQEILQRTLDALSWRQVS